MGKRSDQICICILLLTEEQLEEGSETNQEVLEEVVASKEVEM